MDGAPKTLARGRPILIVEVHGWGTERSGRVMHLLAELGYEIKVIEIRRREALSIAKPVDLINHPRGTGNLRA